MTEIQSACIPLALKGRDLMAQAKTGSGKTAAFGIGLIESLNPKWFAPQGLVICPTRELATQVTNELRRLARYKANIKIVTICGGVPMGPQIGSLEHGAHIVVGTPGRLNDHIRKGTLALDNCSTIVLDEADRMLEMGFIEDIEYAYQQCAPKKQTLLFSATFAKDVQKIAESFLHKHEHIVVDERHVEKKIEEVFYQIANNTQRLEGLLACIGQHDLKQGIIFCNTKVACEEVADFLYDQGVSCEALHGDMDQRQRDQVLTQFHHQSISFLVATDVAARGIDVPSLPAVINYELSRQVEVYVHRIGRTGRADEQGLAISLLTDREKYKHADIEHQQKKHLAIVDIPDVVPVNIQSPYTTICIDGGKKHKVRPGDILGALTKDANIDGKLIGKINISLFQSYVAIDSQHVDSALGRLSRCKIKGKHFRVRKIQ